MAASANDKLQKVGLATATTLDSNYTINDTTVTVASTSGWPTDTGVTFAIDTIDSAGLQVPGSYNEYGGVVSTATSITSVDWADGVGDKNYSAGASTRVYIPVTKTRENRIVDWGLVEHKQDGTHAAVTATSVVSSGAVTGTTITGTSLVSSGDIQHRSTSLETIRSEYEYDFVASGGVWSGDAYASTRNASMTAVTCYINGRRGTISAVTARSFTASKDTYVDVLNNSGTFSLVYTEVANNAASPALAANSIRLAIIVTGASNIAAVGSVNQGEENKVLPIASSIAYSVTDSLGNLICPRDPNRKVLGFRQITGNVTATTIAQATGLSCPVIVPTGRKVKIVVKGSYVAINSAGADARVSIWDGVVNSGTQLQSNQTNTPTSGAGYDLDAEIITTPATTSKTYNVGISASAGTITLGAAATAPAFIKVELA